MVGNTSSGRKPALDAKGNQLNAVRTKPKVKGTPGRGVPDKVPSNSVAQLVENSPFRSEKGAQLTHKAQADFTEREDVRMEGRPAEYQSDVEEEPTRPHKKRQMPEGAVRDIGLVKAKNQAEGQSAAHRGWQPFLQYCTV